MPETSSAFERATTGIRPTIVLASSNPGKIAELQRLIGNLADVTTAAEAGVDLPEETGETFAENAELKARASAQATGAIGLADDSGLAVDALAGAPGIYSARYAGEHASDDENTEKLLDAMQDIPTPDRTAAFHCAIAIAWPDGELDLTEGTCRGAIGAERRGAGGFGYDPIFVLPDGQTMAEKSAEEKNRISHRAQAMAEAVTLLRARLNPSGVEP